MSEAAVPTESKETKSSSQTIRPTLKQRDRLKEIESALLAATAVTANAVAASRKKASEDLLNVDREMSAKINEPARIEKETREKATADKAAAIRKAEDEYKRAVNAATSARAKAKAAAESECLLIRQAASDKFSADVKPVEEWYLAEKKRVADEAAEREAKAAAELAKIAGPLEEEAKKIEEAIEAKRKRSDEGGKGEDGKAEAAASDG